MVKYFLGLNDLKSSWEQVFAAFWQRYPNPYSKHVLTEDVIHREVVQECCVYGIHPENKNWTQIKREAWISSNLYGFSLAIQECGLASFKSSITKTIKGFEYVLAGMQGETPTKTLRETAKEATEKAKETALAAKEKAKDLASKAGPQKKQHYV
ncbi:PRELI domain containing 1a isoform X3 [Cetorhinus maximus]